MTDVELAQQYVALYENRRALEEEAESIRKRMAVMEEPLRHSMIEAGVMRLKLDSGHTLSLQTKVFPAMKDGVDRVAVIAALRADGYGHLVTEGFNGNSMNALVRELAAANDGELPGALGGVYETTDRTEVNVRRGEGRGVANDSELERKA